ncbi:RHS repeat protein [Pleurocapsales cyanobacterium LEGE 10410]|nr:RHS repeat protein [Pleurocapsales cyanobacterium LEGE 10410]
MGNLVQTTLANGVVETREYDELYRLISVDNTDADGNVITYDNNRKFQSRQIFQKLFLCL